MTALLDQLRGLGLEKYHDALVANDVTFDLLATLNETDLRELGFTLGHRKKLISHFRAGDAPQAATPAGQRKQITVLFSDLVGSTQMSAELDPEDTREIMEQYMDLCVEEIRNLEGTIGNFMGDGVLAYFGYPASQEDDAERAIRAGMNILERIGKWTHPIYGPVRARVGIATGLAVVGDLEGAGGEHSEKAVGETLNLAARVQSEAEENQLVIAESTRQLVGALFDYEDRGLRHLKGFEDPVQVWGVTGESAVESRFAARAIEGLTEMMGREAEARTIADLVSKAERGEGQIVLVEGEPGIGKSRLTLTARQTAEAAETPFYRMSFFCQRYLKNNGLHPVIRLLEQIFDLNTGDDVATRFEKIRVGLAERSDLSDLQVQSVAALLGAPVEAEPLASADAAARAKAVMEALIARALDTAAAQPLLIVVEDAHWADPSTVDLIDTLAAEVAGRRIMMMITYRPEFTPAMQPGGNVTHLALNRLDRSAAARVITQRAGGRTLPGDIVDQILEKTDGVPLFVEELTRTVLDSGYLEARGDHYVRAADAVSMEIPATLQDSLMARLDRLAGEKEIAQIGALIGRVFTRDMIGAVVAKPPVTLDRGLRALCDADLIAPLDRGGVASYIFRHALVQDVAGASLLRRRKQELHQTILTRMEEGDPAFGAPEPDVMAVHGSNAGLTEKAMTYWLAAGKKALDRAANKEALEHLRAALAALRDLPENDDIKRVELDLQMSLAPASMAIYGWASKEVEACCVRAAQLAQEVEDYQALYGAMWGVTNTHFLRGEMDEAKASAQNLLDMAEQADMDLLRVPALHTIGFICYYRGEFEECLRHADRGRALFDMENELQIVRMFQFSSSTALRLFRGGALWMLGRQSEVEGALEETRALVRQLNHVPSTAFSHAAMQFVHLWQRDVTRGEEIGDELIEMSLLHGFLLWVPMATVFKGWFMSLRGDVDEGIRMMLENHKLLRDTGTHLILAQTGAIIGETLAAAGREQEALDFLDHMLEDVARRGEWLNAPETYRTRATIRLSGGDKKGAAQDYVAAIDLAKAQKCRPYELRAAHDYAKLLLATAGPQEAATLLRQTLDHDDPEVNQDLDAARKLLSSIRVS